MALGGPDTKLFDSASGNELRSIDVPVLTKGEVLPGSANPNEKLSVCACALAFSPDGNNLAVGAGLGTLWVMKFDR
jgi:hypothetical protein